MLVDPSVCAKEVLHLIYTHMQSPSKSIGRHERDAEIYRRFMSGETAFELAATFKLTVQRIRKIIRSSKI